MPLMAYIWTLCNSLIMKLITFKLIAVTGVLLAVVYFISMHGENRLSVFYHHRIWLPSTVSNIRIIHYSPFIVILDEYAMTTFSIPKSDFEELVDKLKWCDSCYGLGPYSAIPESIKTKFPFQSEFASPNGDFVTISAKQIANDSLRVIFNTDWN
jgi:hypothetical protein